MKNPTLVPDHLAQKTLLRLPAVLALLGIKKSALYAGVSEGVFPAPIKIGPRVSVWPAPTIEALLDKLTTSGE
jgi:predicted DNA-binding transcriptional regulator AlpA